MKTTVSTGVILLCLYLGCVSAVSIGRARRQLPGSDGGSFWDKLDDELTDAVDGALEQLDCGGQLCDTFLDTFDDAQKGLFRELEGLGDTFKFVEDDVMQLSPQERQEVQELNQKKSQFGFSTFKDQSMEKELLDDAIRHLSEESEEMRDAILNMTKKPELFTPEIAMDVDMDMLCFMNLTELKAAANVMTNESRAVMCARSAKTEDMQPCAAQRIAEIVDCGEYFNKLQVKPRGAAAEACLYGILQRADFDIANFTDADWDQAMLCIDGLEAEMIMQIPLPIIKRNICKLSGLLRPSEMEKEVNLEDLDFTEFMTNKTKVQITKAAMNEKAKMAQMAKANKPNFDSEYFNRCDKDDYECLEEKVEDLGVSPDVLGALVQRVTNILRQENVQAFPDEMLRCFAPFFMEFKPTDILAMPDAALFKFADFFVDIEFDEFTQIEVVERLKAALPPIDTWDKDMIIDLFKNVKLDVGIMEGLNASGGLLEAIKDTNFPEFEDEADGFLLGKIVRGVEQFINAENMTADDIVDIKKVLPIMGISIFEKLNDTALFDVFENISDVTGWPDDLGRDMAKFAIKKMGGANNLDSGKFGKLGSLGGYMNTDEIDMLSDDVISDNLDSLNNLRLSKAGQKKLLKKMESAGGNLLENAVQNGTVGKLMKKLPLKKLKELGGSALGFQPESRPMDIECDKSTCKEMFKMTKANGLGEISQNARKYNMKTIKNMGKVACGMGCPEIIGLPKKRETFKIVKHMGELRCLGEVEQKCMAYKIKSMMEFNNQTKLNQFATRENIKSVSQFFKFFNASDLRKLPQQRCYDILSGMGREDFSKVRRSQLTELKNFALSCKNKEDGNSSITTDDMMLIGDIACGMEEKDVARFSVEAITDMLFKWQARCVIQPHIVRALLNKVKMTLNISAGDLTQKEMVQLGAFMTYLEPSDFAQLNRTEVRKAIPRLMKQFQAFEGMRKLREHNYVMDLNSTETADLLAGRDAIYGAILDGITSDGQSRKKRSGSSLTCSEIKMLDDAAAQMTTTQLSNLADSDFVDCAATMGSNEGWSQEQKVALSEVAGRETVWGSHSTWDNDDIAKAGIMTQGLSAANIAMLNITSVDTLASLGQYSGWEATQLEAGFTAFLTNTKGGSIGSVDSTDLGSMGEFGCGATVSEIGSMSTAYAEASSDVGSLTSCSSEQQAAYATLAVSAFGSNVTAWSESDVASVGNMVGGLSESDLTKLTETQIQAMSPASVSSIPAAKFSALSATQVGAMSSSQAASISADQQANMNSDALSALGNSGGNIVVQDNGLTTGAPGGGAGPGGNGAGPVSISLAAIITLLIAAFIM
ncbi:unnamed protein product [Owenia fusiformis]|uniref:Uncharacterized protein n=1 Tax=Owenia fusiformis TaxID=6347 RepID=A0A8J1U586_OWEFU|nr:unnamed protein product [Owenia fusiformis]